MLTINWAAIIEYVILQLCILVFAFTKIIAISEYVYIYIELYLS